MRWRGLAGWGIVILALGLVLFGAWVVIRSLSQPKSTVEIGNATISVTLAKTSDEQAQGLGNVTDLPMGKGMLFVFSNDGPQAMWMKDMRLPLDIIWLSSAKKVTHIEHSLTPDTYPKTYISPTPARYVLEVPAGTATANDIKVGMVASFDTIDT